MKTGAISPGEKATGDDDHPSQYNSRLRTGGAMPRLPIFIRGKRRENPNSLRSV